MKVRAFGREPGQTVGIYGGKRIKNGDEFNVDEKDYCAKWMAKVSPDEVPSDPLAIVVEEKKPTAKGKGVLG